MCKNFTSEEENKLIDYIEGDFIKEQDNFIANFNDFKNEYEEFLITSVSNFTHEVINNGNLVNLLVVLGMSEEDIEIVHRGIFTDDSEFADLSNESIEFVAKYNNFRYSLFYGLYEKFARPLFENKIGRKLNEEEYKYLQSLSLEDNTDFDYIEAEFLPDITKIIFEMNVEDFVDNKKFGDL